MSDATFDSVAYFSSPTDWYSGRAFKVAFAASVAVHAVLIAALPGLRAVPVDSPPVLQVDIAQTAPEVPVIPIETAPVAPPKRVEPREERVPQPRRVEPPPEPLVQKVQPEPALPPRTDIIEAPRPELKPEFVVPKVETPAPVEVAKPEPKVEPPPAPIARVEPPPQPTIERAPNPLPEPRTAVVPDTKPIPREPVVAPQAKAPDGESTDRYRQMISAMIRQHQQYPQIAQRRRWEGTTLVKLQFSAEGKVTDISVEGKSGHDALDEAAIKMVRSVPSLPIPPEGLRIVVVPIKFRLDS